MRIHDLKSWPAFFEHVRAGTKTFELRRDDRGFDVGDKLLIREWDPVLEKYTGRKEERFVSYITEFPDALRDGFICMGFRQ